MSQLPKPAYRLTNLQPYGFAIIGQRIQTMTAAGKDVIRLDIGSPDLPPPQPVIEALKQSSSNPVHHSYGSYTGDPGFRRAVADYYARRFGVPLDPATEVLPLIGSKEGLVNLSMAYLDRGDSAIVPDIAYPAYEAGALLAGASGITVHLYPAKRFPAAFDPIPDQPFPAHKLWAS